MFSAAACGGFATLVAGLHGGRLRPARPDGRPEWGSYSPIGMSEGTGADPNECSWISALAAARPVGGAWVRRKRVSEKQNFLANGGSITQRRSLFGAWAQGRIRERAKFVFHANGGPLRAIEDCPERPESGSYSQQNRQRLRVSGRPVTFPAQPRLTETEKGSGTSRKRKNLRSFSVSADPNPESKYFRRKNPRRSNPSGAPR